MPPYSAISTITPCLLTAPKEQTKLRHQTRLIPSNDRQHGFHSCLGWIIAKNTPYSSLVTRAPIMSKEGFTHCAAFIPQMVIGSSGRSQLFARPFLWHPRSIWLERQIGDHDCRVCASLRGFDITIAGFLHSDHSSSSAYPSDTCNLTFYTVSHKLETDLRNPKILMDEGGGEERRTGMGGSCE